MSYKFKLRKLDGTFERVDTHRLEALRMQMDWQLRASGYHAASVNAALSDLEHILDTHCLPASVERAGEL